MQTRCQLKGSLNLSSGICRNRAVSFLFCTTWQHSLGDFLLLGNFLFHHEIEHALCTCLVVTATKKCESDRELSETDNRLTENRIPVSYFCMPCRGQTHGQTDFWARILSVLQWVCQTSVYPWVCSWLGRALKLTPNLLFSIPTAILTLFVRCNINSLDFFSCLWCFPQWFYFYSH